jgi:mRNA interferase RelE/StbE
VLIYHPDVRDVDIPRLNETLKRRIKKAIEERLLVSPYHYGKPLRRSLKGYWKLRVGDYRVVYKVVGNEVRVFAIINRKEIYMKSIKRIRD